MKERDLGAFIAGVILGFVATYLVFVAARSFAHAGMFLILSLVFPLIVSLIAGKRIILMALIPNLTLSLCLAVYFIFLSPDIYGIEVVYAVSLVLTVSTVLALLVSVPIHLLRNRREKQKESHHIFTRND